MKVSECKLIEPVSCAETATITEVARMIAQKNTRYVIVTKNDQPIGIISVVDIVTRVVAQGKDPSGVKAADVMTKPLDIIDGQTSLEEAYVYMIKKNVFSMPITNNGKLIGVLPFSQSYLKSKQ